MAFTPETEKRLEKLKQIRKRIQVKARRETLLLKMAQGIPLGMLDSCEIVQQRQQSSRVITRKDRVITCANSDEVFACPDCCENVIHYGDFYCPNCGLKLKWSKNICRRNH